MCAGRAGKKQRGYTFSPRWLSLVCHRNSPPAPDEHSLVVQAMAKAAVLAGPSPNGLMVAFKMC